MGCRSRTQPNETRLYGRLYRDVLCNVWQKMYSLEIVVFFSILPYNIYRIIILTAVSTRHCPDSESRVVLTAACLADVTGTSNEHGPDTLQSCSVIVPSIAICIVNQS